jgi:hypothetical protein
LSVDTISLYTALTGTQDGLANRFVQRIQKFKQHTLAVKKHDAIYFIWLQTAMPNPSKI